jgi:hypothetical protein
MFRQRRRRPPAEFFQPEVEIPFPLSLDALLLKISRSGGSGRRPLIRRGPARRAQPCERPVAIEQPLDGPLPLVAELGEEPGDGLPVLENKPLASCPRK